MSRPRVAISMGDPCGIGPEVLIGALSDETLRASLTPVIFGDDQVWARAEAILGTSLELPVLTRAQNIPETGALVRVTDLGANAAPFGGGTDASGRAQKAYIEAASEYAARGKAAALCTAPVSKGAVARAGVEFSGHTEFLRDRLGATDVRMMLAGPTLRVVLVTTHVAISEVPGLITEARVYDTVVLAVEALERWFGVKEPRIAVCGLNPHAGEDGQFGDEDQREIFPAVQALRSRGYDVEGPVPADAAMAAGMREQWDVVIAMYHDQGLGPIKALHFDEAVNVTLGLPIPRTAPDHGSALDIAGQGVARPEAMKAALRLAVELAEVGV